MKNINGWNRLFILVSGLWLLASIFTATDQRDFGNNHFELIDDGTYENKLSESSKKLIVPNQSYNLGGMENDMVVSLKPFDTYEDAPERPFDPDEFLRDKENDKNGSIATRVIKVYQLESGRIAEPSDGESLKTSKWIAEFSNNHAMTIKESVSFKEFMPAAEEYLFILKYEWNLKNLNWWLIWLTQSWIVPLCFIYILGASSAWVLRGFKTKA
jgi:hypothetical protein